MPTVSPADDSNTSSRRKSGTEGETNLVRVFALHRVQRYMSGNLRGGRWLSALHVTPGSEYLMGDRLYVSGLPYAVTEEELSDLFTQHGTVSSARIITDRFTGRSRGFGFVEMASQEAGNAAMENMNGKDMGGRQLVVNEARPRPSGGGGRGGAVAMFARGVIEDDVISFFLRLFFFEKRRLSRKAIKSQPKTALPASQTPQRAIAHDRRQSQAA